MPDCGKKVPFWMLTEVCNGGTTCINNNKSPDANHGFVLVRVHDGITRSRRYVQRMPGGEPEEAECA